MNRAREESILTLVFEVTSTAKSLQESIDEAYNNGYGLISYPLVESESDSAKLITTLNASLTNVPFKYSSDSHSSIFESVYGKISSWLTFHCDNDDNKATEHAAHCIELLHHELDWSLHLGIHSVILPSPSITCTADNKSDDNDDYLCIAVNYASAIISAFKKHQEMIGIIPISLSVSGWKLWRILSVLLRDIKTVRPALIIECDSVCSDLIEQWFAEGVQIFLLSHNVFLTNKKGFPVLSRSHQKLLQRFLRWSDITIIVNGECNERYTQYLRHLRSLSIPLKREEFEEKPFWDVLQSPLQPLTHNLEYATYETFESDPIKYMQYEKAIVQCLIDLDGVGSCGGPFVVMVLGAGRGPLVSAAISAHKSSGINIKLYAVEKNPFAVIILRNKNETEWNGLVEIVAQDMRRWKYPEKAHIIVSELLGSFGDNELSPECLDGAQSVLRNDGICIPSKYTSYLCPITNNSVYSRLKESPKDFETPYIIHLLRHCLLSEIKKCWSFNHPIKDNANKHSNQRFCKLTFKINKKNESIIHGFAGYFDVVLYDNVTLSIHPKTASKDMFSWFPIYFPLINPILCKQNDDLTICLSRKSDNECMWYEWTVIKPVLSQIHNVNHRSYKVNLQ